MAKQNHIVKINLPGGIISSGDLRTIIKACEAAGVKEIQMSKRQQMYLPVGSARLNDLTVLLEEGNLFYETDLDEYPNIVSSYFAHELFNDLSWLTEDVYADILGSFDHTPELKINIADHTQTLVPFFTGNINFISSNIPNYWFLYIRFPKTSINYHWKGLVCTSDISSIAKNIENVILKDQHLFYDKATIIGELLQEKVDSKQDFFYNSIVEELKLPVFNLPYYEGINRYGQKLWLGIYRRDELFQVEFLKDVCAICLKTKIGQVYTTPWKSMIVKGIDPEDEKYWSYILGKHFINVRHAFNELNWQLEDLSPEGLNIKRHLVRRFDSVDIKSNDLCFAIKTQPRSGLFGSVIIKKLPNFKKGQARMTNRFDILYTRDFNPNSKDYIQYKSKISLSDLEVHLIALSKFYYEQRGLQTLINNDLKLEEQKTEREVVSIRTVYQCRLCFTVYDDVYGDEINGIKKGIPFGELPAHYCCPVCESGLELFMPIDHVEQEV